MWITKSERDFLSAQIYLILPLPPPSHSVFGKLSILSFFWPASLTAIGLEVALMLVALCDLVFQFGAGVQASEEVKMDVKAVETGGQVSRTRNIWETMSTILINYYAGATSAAGDVRTFFSLSFSLSLFLFSFYFLHFRGNPVWDMRNGQSPDRACPIMAGPVCGCCHLLNSSLWKTYMCTNPHLPFAYIPIFRAPMLNGCFSSVSLSLGPY